LFFSDILRDFLTSVATVKRDGEWRGLSSRFVVAGDLLRLKMGDVVPADVVLLPGGESLEVDQVSDCYV
jgi:H+-transporting ATPase